MGEDTLERFSKLEPSKTKQRGKPTSVPQRNAVDGLKCGSRVTQHSLGCAKNGLCVSLKRNNVLSPPPPLVCVCVGDGLLSHSLVKGVALRYTTSI